MKFLLIFFFLFLCVFNAGAQNSLNYIVNTGTTGELLKDKNTNIIKLDSETNLIINNTSSVNTALIPIGFDFIFMGKYYTHFIAGNDGQVGLGISSSSTSMLSGAAANDLTRNVVYPPTASNNAAVLAAFWDDLKTPIAGMTIRSQLVGVAPNRCRVIQWNTLINSYSVTNSTDTADGLFQMRLYENSGEVEYVYGKMVVGSTGSSGVCSASIGFTAGSTDSTFLALNDLNNFTFTTIAANEAATQNVASSFLSGPITPLHSVSEGNRRFIRFTPKNAPAGSFNSLTFSNLTSNSIQINWADNFSNELGYLVYRSVDGNNFDFITSLPANTTNFVVNNLGSGVNYTWKVVVFTEGLSSSITRSQSTSSCSGGLNGVIKIGTNSGDNYPTLTNALIALKNNGLAGNVILELQPGYNPNNETYPITFRSNPCQDLKTVTIRPALNASPVSFANYIYGDNTFILDSVSNLIIDGRFGGVGNEKGITILNNSFSGSAVLFRNDAQKDTLKYVILEGKNTTQTGGVIIFSTTGYSTGNSYNSIENCDIRNTTSTLLSQLIYALGTNGKQNINNSIKNCNFYEIGGSASTGIYTLALINIQKNNSNWTVQGNSFYQLVANNSYYCLSFYFILVNSPGGKGFQINNNYFGGTQPQCNGTMPVISCSNNEFNMIAFLAGSGDTSRIENNIFTNFTIEASGPSSSTLYNALINLQGGLISCQNNILGSATAADAIVFNFRYPSNDNSAYPAPRFAGIEMGLLNAGSLIKQNTISGIKLLAFSNIQSTNMFAFSAIATVNGGGAIIQNNTIGSASVTNAIYSTSSTSILQGISGVDGSYNVKDNIIQNMRSYGDSAITLNGINFSGANPVIQNNSISHLSFIGKNSSLIGIQAASSVKGNTIHTLNNTSSTADNFSIIGVSGASITSENFIHSFAAKTAAQNIKLDGISTLSSTSPATCRNNMIRIGIDSAGNAVGGDFSIAGIRGNTCTNYQHNTIYIGGQVNATNNNSTGCMITSTNCAPNNFTNNILINNRTNPAGNFKHYQYQINLSDFAFVSSNGNIFYNNSGGFNCRLNGKDYTSLLTWVNNVKKDSLSFVGQPFLINPEGNASSVNLHVMNTTLAEGNGINNPATTIDFDGQLRASNSPIDIGADAGLFDSTDIYGPVIIPSIVINPTIGYAQNIKAIIRDKSKVDTSGNHKPRLWFRKSSPSVSQWFSVAGAFVSGNVFNGTWNFTPIYSAVGLTVNGGDSIQYYFVAQDSLPLFNVGYANSLGAKHTDVNTQLTPPDILFSYRIIPVLGDTILVGAGKPFQSLTKTGGLFEAFNNDLIALNKDIVVLVTSDLDEDGTNRLTNHGLNGFKLNIKPSADTIRNISNSVNLINPLITINAAKNVTIDGSFNNAGNFLRFVNTHKNPFANDAVIAISNGCDSVTISNIIAESNQRISLDTISNSGIILLGLGNNTNIKILHSKFHDATTGTTGIYENAIQSNSGGNQVWIEDNDIYNFRSNGVNLTNIADKAVIKSNHFYYNMPMPATDNQQSINIYQGKGHLIYGNYIGGTARNCSGTPWLNTGNEVDTSGYYGNRFSFIGIEIQVGGSDTTKILNNTIQNIQVGNHLVAFIGISVDGLAKVSGNLVGHPTNTDNILNSSNGPSTRTVGIATGRLGSVLNNEIINNEIANLTSPGVGFGSNSFNDLYGMFLFSNQYIKVTNNKIHHLSCNSMKGGPTANSTPVTGIFFWSGMNGYHCEGNSIWALKATNTAKNVGVRGIYTAAYTTANIFRNKIYDLQSFSDSGGVIVGIYNFGSQFNYINNQISLTNTNTKNVSICGILNSSGPSSFYYNSIYIGGNNSGDANSYGIKIDGNNTLTQKFANNILYNNRIGAGGSHYAISLVTNFFNVNWSPTASNNNLFISTDTSKLAEWGVCCTGYPKSMKQWRAATLGDSASYGVLNTNLPADSFFINPVEGNLNINNTKSLCWYANGKGMPFAAISGDFDSAANVRSTSIINGATDIGSDEFNTTTTPIPLVFNGNHLPGGTDTLSMGSHIVAIISWGNSGTLPTMGEARFYSGQWPNDTTNDGTVLNARYMNGYLTIPAVGGINYTYSLKLFYDSSMLGKIKDEATMRINKRQQNVNGSWTNLAASTVNTQLKTITVNNINSFSEFTCADANASLASVNNLQCCKNGNTTLTAPLTGTSYQWQMDNGNGFANLTDNLNFSGSNSLVLQLINIPSIWYGAKIRCVVNGVNTTPSQIRISNTWTGSINSNWEDPGNWNCNSLPDEYTDVNITNGNVILNSNQTVRSLNVNSGTTITVNSGKQLIIKH